MGMRREFPAGTGESGRVGVVWAEQNGAMGHLGVAKPAAQGRQILIGIHDGALASVLAEGALFESHPSALAGWMLGDLLPCHAICHRGLRMRRLYGASPI